MIYSRDEEVNGIINDEFGQDKVQKDVDDTEKLRQLTADDVLTTG